jgi:uncharacterized protein YbbC (DUF1343 family)
VTGLLNVGHPQLLAAPPDVGSPGALGFHPAPLATISDLVQTEIDAGNLPGCVVAIGRTAGLAHLQAYGDRQLQPAVERMTDDTVFDMASLTKPVATATSIMLLVERGLVRLGDPVANYLPEFAQNGKQDITIEQLLTHQGGLIPDNALADYEHGAEVAWERIFALRPKVDPGTQFIYTDVGFLVLGKVVEKVSGRPLDQFAREEIFKPLGMDETGYLPAAPLAARAAPTEQRDGQWLRGVVHDPRAALLDGVAGHAGLFSTARDLARYATVLLQHGCADHRPWMGAQTLVEMTTARDVAGHRRGLGWDMRSKYSSNRGETMSRRAFGHGGFTGTAMWIDPQLDLYVIFLSNRLHPDGEGSVNPLAGRIGTLAASALNACADHAPTTRLGIDVLVADQFQALAGKRVGLIANHTSLAANGQRTIDLLHRSEQIDLVAIFSPEHGLQGKLDQPQIDDTRDAATGLPVWSLYGATRQPSAEQLAQIDALVFDIQDIGARFYTYISTMGMAMEAAARHRVQFVVLDRPNPLAGLAVEGPQLDRGRESFVGYHALPIRHGMTIGELAEMFRSERQWDLQLTVVPVQGWRRSEYWDRTGLTWVNPSPNIRSLLQAIYYPGIGLLETTNLSVGRGTDAPFEQIGAPWIDGRELAAALNEAGVAGVRFVPITFTPTSSKFAGEKCGGVNFTPIDRNALQPVTMGLQIACTLRALYPDQWQVDGLDRLLIDQEVLAAIRAEKSLTELEALIAPEVQEFQERRRPFLRYP